MSYHHWPSQSQIKYIPSCCNLHAEHSSRCITIVDMPCSSLRWAWCSLRPTLQWFEFQFPLWSAMLRQGGLSWCWCCVGRAFAKLLAVFACGGYDSALNQTGLLISHWSGPLKVNGRWVRSFLPEILHPNSGAIIVIMGHNGLTRLCRENQAQIWRTQMV